MAKNIIEVKNLSKSFEISSKEPGIKGTLKHFIKRETKNLKVINKINFKTDQKKPSIFEKILTVLLGYFLMPLILSIPFYLSIYNYSY